VRFPISIGRSDTRARINGAEVLVRSDETLLQAALRQGIEFPNSCRVGGCGTCKCQVTKGEVQELTDSSYVLSAEDLAAGMVLACQSRPRTDLDVTVKTEEKAAATVVRQERLTHDITRLVVRSDRKISFRPGQFVSVTLDNITRTYSLAAPQKESGEVEFFIRYVPGGQFSGRVQNESLIGRTVLLGEAAGDFWLRQSTSPLMFVAGGSGLAPILAILREQVSVGKTDRPVTLLFGARTERDVYCLDELNTIAASWSAPFQVIPVLSESDPSDDWSGARGLVTEHIAPHFVAGTEAYLCGPPRMVDAGQAAFMSLGVSSENIHFDRFVTAADVESQSDDAVPAKLWDYLKFGLFHVVGLASAMFLLAGGHYITVGMLTVVLGYLFGDALGGDDTSTPHFQHPAVLTVLLWLALPLLTFICFASVWSVSPNDIFGFGAFVGDAFGVDILATKATTTVWQHIAGVVLTGLMIGMVGTIPAHELTHRTWDSISLYTGRWLLAFSFDTIFSIEHVYGHHRYVSTTHDPATAPRGRNVYWHVLQSSIRGNLSAWVIEANRLKKTKRSALSFHNRVISGHLMSLSLVLLTALLAGVQAAGYFVLCALFGKALLEVVNYMEHYGMVRDPADPVRPHHSWNTNRRMSSWTMFNLTRHSHHHAQGEVPYHELRPYGDAPMMIGGYLTTIIVALIPPLWHKLMTPKVLEWDRAFATDKERILAARANAKSGIPALMREASGQASANASVIERASTRRLGWIVSALIACFCLL
jgi:NAD(P)H-flavin reductase/ferredoxin